MAVFETPSSRTPWSRSRVGAIDALAVQAADARAEAHADHDERGEVDLGVAVGVGVVLFEVEVALVVQHAVEHTKDASRSVHSIGRL